MDDKDVQLKLQNDLLASIHNSNIKLQIENDNLKEKVNRFNITKLEKDNKSLKGSCKSLGRKINNQRKELKRLNDKLHKLEEIINKAIEKLNDNHEYCDSDFESMRFQNDIIEILKGDSNEL